MTKEGNYLPLSCIIESTTGNINWKSDTTYWMENVVEPRTRGQAEVVSEASHPTHCQKHCNWRAKGEEIVGAEVELWVVDEWNSSACIAHHEIH